jgi:lipoate-protein ligase A
VTGDGPPWAVHTATGSAAEFHARALEGEVRRAVHVWTVDRPALVLGSTQPAEVVDRAACDAAGIEVVRRRSGGGAVLLEPGDAVWIDVELPRVDPRWDDDVARATWWLGERWAAALASLGVTDPVVHRGPMVTTEWSRTVCFAGLGPGEVTDDGGAKLLGLAQRRTRAGARFQCAVPLRWEPRRLLDLLELPAGADRGAVAAALEGAARAVASPAPAVVAAFLEQL